jgi:hypothetical protein
MCPLHSCHCIASIAVTGNGENTFVVLAVAEVDPLTIASNGSLLTSAHNQHQRECCFPFIRYSIVVLLLCSPAEGIGLQVANANLSPHLKGNGQVYIYIVGKAVFASPPEIGPSRFPIILP